jgi:hypothetical protein
VKRPAGTNTRTVRTLKLRPEAPHEAERRQLRRTLHLHPVAGLAAVELPLSNLVGKTTPHSHSIIILSKL